MRPPYEVNPPREKATLENKKKKKGDKPKGNSTMPKVELKHKRKPNVKHYQLEGNKFQALYRSTPFHYNDGKGLVDIDLTPYTQGVNYVFDKCPHTLEVRNDKAAFTFTGNSGTVTVALDSIGGVKIGGVKTPTWDGTKFLWSDIATDIDFEVIPKNTGLISYVVLKSATAVKNFEYSYSGDNIFTPIRGRDAAGKHCELTTSITTNAVSITWTGNVATEQELRAGTWTKNTTYPVRIDPSINETVTTGTDDGYTAINTFQFFAASHVFAGYSAGIVGTLWGGVRFQTIGIPQGATIDSATLTVDVNHITGSPSVRVYADDADDVPTWSTSSRIKNITKTTAYAAWAPTVTGTQTINIQSVVQEIINRGGWASDNDMRFAAFDQVGTGTNTVGWAALEHTTDAESELDVTYTVAGGALPVGKGLTDPNFINPRSLVR